MWAARVTEGLVFGGLEASALETLKGVPMLLESEDPRVRERLLPETCEHVDAEADWRQHAVPELERLFASRSALVRRDLAAVKKLQNYDAHVLLIPDGHASAWLAALNGARLALFALAGLSAKHLEADGFEGASPKQQEAVLRIHLMAELQSVLLGDLEVDDTGVSFRDFLVE